MKREDIANVNEKKVIAFCTKEMNQTAMEFDWNSPTSISGLRFMTGRG
jgi:adenine deaminase